MTRLVVCLALTLLPLTVEAKPLHMAARSHPSARMIEGRARWQIAVQLTDRHWTGRRGVLARFNPQSVRAGAAPGSFVGKADGVQVIGTYGVAKAAGGQPRVSVKVLSTRFPR